MVRRTAAGVLFIVFMVVLSAMVEASEVYPEMMECGNSGDTVRKEVYDDGRIYDISHRIIHDMPCWGLTEGLGSFLWLAASMNNGSLINNSKMKLSTHTGTHVDAPGHVFSHYYDAGLDVDTLDLAMLNGPALLVDVLRDKNLTDRRAILATTRLCFLPQLKLRSLCIFPEECGTCFQNLEHRQGLMYNMAFDTSYMGFMRDGARWLVDNTDTKLVRIDYFPPRIAREQGKNTVLRTNCYAAVDSSWGSKIWNLFTLTQEMILVEGLNLDDVPAGLYAVHCLRLRLLGSDESTIRCNLIK